MILAQLTKRLADRLEKPRPAGTDASSAATPLLRFRPFHFFRPGNVLAVSSDKSDEQNDQAGSATNAFGAALSSNPAV